MEGDNKSLEVNRLQLEEDDKMPNRNSKILSDDGAEEKLVPEDGKINKKDLTEVKFVSTDSQNGDAKIDIETVKIAFAGMGKEELMKFANDPFWVRVRWVMFILFWLLWVAMLAGAIAIIVMAPKCASPAPLKWWEQGPLYEVNIPTFKDGSGDGVGDLKGLQSKIDYLKDLGVKGVIISPIFSSSVTGDQDMVVNFTEIDRMYGTVVDVRNLTAAFKEKGIHLVMKMVPNYSSLKHDWFIKSEQRIAPYTDYYVWANGNGTNTEGEHLPPNNWISVMNTSAWTWSDKRQQYYLHQFREDQPDLNFTNSLVVDEILNIMEFWLEQGVSGFILDKTEFLLEDSSLKNDPLSSKSGCDHTQYCFYKHMYTRDLPEVKDLLMQWRQAVKNSTEDDRFFAVSLDFTQVYDNSTSDLALEYSPSILDKLKSSFTAQNLFDVVEGWLNETVIKDSRPAWQLGVNDRTASILGEDYVDGLNFIMLLLPGTPVIYYGEELGLKDPLKIVMPWANDSSSGFSDQFIDTSLLTSVSNTYVEQQEKADDSHLKVFRAAASLRNSLSVKYGTFEKAIVNGTVFAFTRIKSGTPGFLVALHVGDLPTTVDLSVVKGVPDELTVHIQSQNYVVEGVQEKAKLSASSVHFPPRSALVLTFVPKAS